MKQIILLIAVVIALCSCTPQPAEDTEEQDATAKLNIELVKKMFISIEEEDIETLKEILDTSFTEIGPGIDDELSYAETIEGNIYFYEAWDSIKFNLQYIMHETVQDDVKEDWVLSWSLASMYNIELEKSFKIRYHNASRIEDGKIVYTIVYWDRLDLFEQMGAELDWGDDDDDEEHDD
jgi:ketosteroid isomerase-like protein